MLSFQYILMSLCENENGVIRVNKKKIFSQLPLWPSYLEYCEGVEIDFFSFLFGSFHDSLCLFF